jgi:hypothetical protein
VEPTISLAKQHGDEEGGLAEGDRAAYVVYAYVELCTKVVRYLGGVVLEILENL